MLHKFTPLLVLVSLAVVMISLLVLTKQGFFIRTGQHNIYEMGLSGKFERPSGMGQYEDNYLVVPPEKPADTSLASILGENVNGNKQSFSTNKRIEVDLSTQKLYAYEGDNLVYNFAVSTGKPWWATPTGEFRTWIKLRYARMRGGSKALGTYYDLPNVPHVMYFENEKVPGWKGYGIHGAYWHNNFGHPMSHGCVNLQLGEAEQIFNWAGMRTRVIIYGQTPNS